YDAEAAKRRAQQLKTDLSSWQFDAPSFEVWASMLMYDESVKGGGGGERFLPAHAPLSARRRAVWRDSHLRKPLHPAQRHLATHEHGQSGVISSSEFKPSK
ncbi:MAG: hypothetical protein SGPRY_001826, partial [Prymnesium sp.]